MAVERQQPAKSMLSFLVIWVGQQFSIVGSHIVQFALVWWVTKATGSATILATGTLVAMIPQVFLGPIAGTLVDRWNRRLVMIVADAVVALSTLWLAFMFWSGQIQVWHVFVVMFVRSLGGAFHWPAMQASTSLMVPDRHLSRVAGLNQTTMGLLNIVGPALGALLLEVLVELHYVVMVDIFTALLAIAPLLFVAVPQPDRSAEAAANGGQKPSVWADFRAGLRYVRAWPGLMAVIGMAMVINFVATPAFSLMPILITKHFQGGAGQLAAMDSTWGAGVALGGLFLSMWGGFKRKVFTSLVGLMLMGTGVVIIGVAPATLFGVAVAGMFLSGFMNPITNGPLFAVMQSIVTPDMQGRVFTLLGSGASAMTPISLLVAGPVADAVGVQWWFVVGGLTCVLMGIGALFVPAIMNLEKGREAQAAGEAMGTPAIKTPGGAAADAEQV